MRNRNRETGVEEQEKRKGKDETGIEGQEGLEGREGGRGKGDGWYGQQGEGLEESVRK